MKFIHLLLLFCLFSSLTAQFHDNHWLMGYSGGDQSPPDDSFGISVLSFYEAELKIKNNQTIDINFNGSGNGFSDYFGNLQLYSNNLEIRDSTDQVISNGFISGNGDPEQIVAQSSVFLPFASNDVVYYVSMSYSDELPFVGAQISFFPINLEIPISISQQEIEIYSNSYTTGELTACCHANGRDWWVLAPSADDSKVYSFLVQSNGTIETNVLDLGNINLSNGLGQAKFSPDGTIFARLNLVAFGEPDYLDIFDFDRCTGSLTNHRQTNISDATSAVAGGLSFSPSSQYLYVSHYDHIFQFDLWDDNVFATMDTVAVYDGYTEWNFFTGHFYQAQLAPDGKIYLNSPSGINKLHVIEFPDRQGVACDVRQHSIPLPNNNSFTLANHPHYRLGPIDGSECDTLGIDNLPRAYFRIDRNSEDTLDFHFQNLSFYEPTSYNWTFGDGATSDDFHANHTFAQPDIYEVCLTVSNSLGTDTYCRALELGPSRLDEMQASRIKIITFPNPTSDVLVLDLGDYLPLDGKFILRDALGREVFTEQVLYRQARIDLSGLPPSTYYYSFWDLGQKINQGKVVLVGN